MNGTGKGSPWSGEVARGVVLMFRTLDNKEGVKPTFPTPRVKTRPVISNLEVGFVLLDCEIRFLAGIGFCAKVDHCHTQTIITFSQRGEIEFTRVGNARRILDTFCFDSKGWR
jgi:hypothetical protein